MPARLERCSKNPIAKCSEREEYMLIHDLKKLQEQHGRLIAFKASMVCAD